MCKNLDNDSDGQAETRKKIPLEDSIGLTLAHDITEIRPGEIKCRAYRRGHTIQKGDIEHLQRLGKENIFVLEIGDDEMHEDEAACRLAAALIGDGAAIKGEPKEGRINIVAERDGLLKVNREALLRFNMLSDVMCATLHDNTLVEEGSTIAGTRAIPLVVKRSVIEDAETVTKCLGKVLTVKHLRKPKAGVVITGNEVFHGRIIDAFEPVIRRKIEAYQGEVIGVSYAPDDKVIITKRLGELMEAGADLLITTGGMSVDPDDVTRFAIRNLGASGIAYGSAALPGAMFLVAYLESMPVLGIPACAIHHRVTVFDLVLPRILAGERVGRKELAELGHGGLCMNCAECRYPRCPFGKS